MATTSEFIGRLRALAINVAALEITAKQCARDLDSLLDLAVCFDQHPPRMGYSPEPLHVGRFIVDRATFSVSDGKRLCVLGNTIGFRFFECLASEPNRYFTRSQLLAAVWDGQRRAATTVRSTVFELRNQFRKAGMDELADSLRTDGRAYGLMFDGLLRWPQRKTNG